MTCDTYSDLIIFYYVKTGLNIIYIATPIIIIVMSSIDLFNVVIKPNNEITNKFWNNLFKRLVASLVIFLIPTLINSTLYFFKIDNYHHCFDIATTKNIEKLEQEENAKQELEKKKKQEEENNNNNTNTYASYFIPVGNSDTINNSLGLPYYNQCDSRWSTITYDTGGATLCKSSCGYTSLAMVASGLSHNNNINPYTVVKDIRGLSDGQKSNRGYGAASTSELTNSKYLIKYGIRATNINTNNIVNNLQNGHPIIVLVPGHYITLSISNNGNIVVMDPYTNWSSKLKGPGEYGSIADIQRAYGEIKWAAAYSKL